MADIGETVAIKTEQQRKQTETNQEAKGTNWKVIQGSIIVIALLFVPVQYFSIYGKPEAPPPDKTDTAEMTDVCIATLLKIAELLHQGKIPGDEYRCPISNRPYIITRNNNDIIVSDPNPGLHGLTEFKVSNHYPEPVFRE